jgi:hypothetical protein
MGKAEEDWPKAETHSLIVGIIPDVSSNDMVISFVRYAFIVVFHYN